MDKKVKLDSLFVYLVIAFIVLTIPRSFDAYFPSAYSIINVIKMIIVACSLFLMVKKKISPSKFTVIFIVYCIFLFISTLVNHVSPITFMKVYGLNIGMLCLCDIIFNQRFKVEFLKFISHYFLILLVINAFLIVLGFMLNNPVGQISNTYFLGMDNRFILYILPAILGYYYVYQIEKRDIYKKLMYITYTLGLVSLTILWSVSAALVLIIIGILYLIVPKIYKKNISISKLTIALFVLSILIVFFRIQNLFEFFITGVLHKSMTLSYRTLIWDDAILMFKNSASNLLYGFGYFDTRSLFPSVPLKVNHLHNLIMNNLFFAGIIGSAIYYTFLYSIVQRIKNIKNKYQYQSISILFGGVILLMIFDTFELYQVYYMLMYMIFSAPIILNKRKELKLESSQKEMVKNKNKKVGIMMATYNGEKYIKEQIESIINQTYTNWVLYISDDNSKDNTINIIKEYQKRYPQKIKILSHKEKLGGAKKNFSYLFSKVSKCDYYMFSDQDDVFDKEKIIYLLWHTMKAEEENECVLTYCDSAVVDQNLNMISPSLVDFANKQLPDKNLLEHLLVENYFPGCAIMLNEALKNKINKIYDGTEMHDWWVTLVGGLTGKIVYVDKSLHLYRQHENNTIGAHQNNSFINTIIKRAKKLFNIKKLFTTWHTYQTIVESQAKELCRLYNDETNSSTVKRFIQIMEEKNRVKKLCLLIKLHYTPKELIRVLRLVL